MSRPQRQCMSPPLLMIVRALLFAWMGVCVKLASAQYGAGEIVLYRSLVGLALMAAVTALAPRPAHAGAGDAFLAQPQRHHVLVPVVLRHRRPAAGHRDDAQLHVVGVDRAVPGRWRRVARPGRAASTAGSWRPVWLGFAGVALVLRPTLEQDQLWHGLMGLLSGLLSATAYLQVTALGRVGEPG